MNILELHNLKKYFATQKAVYGISLEIGKGKIFGLLGPNGAGKILKINIKKNNYYLINLYPIHSLLFCHLLCIVLHNYKIMQM